MDLKPLKKYVMQEVYILPTVKETLATGAKFFSKLDTNSFSCSSQHSLTLKVGTALISNLMEFGVP